MGGGRNTSSITIINIPLFLSEVMHKWVGLWLMNPHSKTLLFHCFQQFFTLYPSKHYFLLCNVTIKKFYTSCEWERGRVTQKRTRKLWEREVKSLGGRGGAAGWGGRGFEKAGRRVPARGGHTTSFFRRSRQAHFAHVQSVLNCVGRGARPGALASLGLLGARPLPPSLA